MSKKYVVMQIQREGRTLVSFLFDFAFGFQLQKQTEKQVLRSAMT